MQKDKMTNKIVLITGANSGIGKATAIALARMEAHVVMAVRNKEKAEEARREVIKASGNNIVDLMQCNLASMDSIRKFASEFLEKYNRLDVLINNAGIFSSHRQETTDGFEYQFGVNHLGHFLLTNLFLDLLIKSAPSRIVIVSSLGHFAGRIHFANLQLEKHYNPWKSYFQSKLATILFAYELSGKLNGSGVTVNSLHPGVVRTRFAVNRSNERQNFVMRLSNLINVSPSVGAETSVYLASSPEVEGVTGKYFVRKKARASSKASYNLEVAEKLWKLSEELTGTGA
jgi:NAD(P)-dependent dehydrogenase (short-subunit alcohol dehydrogenase family)